MMKLAVSGMRGWANETKFSFKVRGGKQKGRMKGSRLRVYGIPLKSGVKRFVRRLTGKS